MAENNETFKDILDSITSKLTGDREKDFKYLQNMCEQYKDHRYAKEIIRALSRKMYDLLPKEERERISQLTKNQNDYYQSVIDEVKFNMYKRDVNKALSLIEPLVHEVDEQAEQQDDTESEYYSFDEMFEEVLYNEINHPEREVRRSPIPYSDIYFLHGNLLVELGRIEEAQESLRKAMRWNPCSSQIRFEYVETLKIQKKLDEYLKEVCKAFKYIFKPQFLARAYRDIGYYFIEKEMYSEAASMYHLSLQVEPDSRTAVSELYYIEQTLGKEPELLSGKEMKALSEKYNFPIGPDKKVVKLAYGLGKYLYENGDSQRARYLLKIGYDLIPVDDAKEIIARIDKIA